MKWLKSSRHTHIHTESKTQTHDNTQRSGILYLQYMHIISGILIITHNRNECNLLIVLHLFCITHVIIDHYMVPGFQLVGIVLFCRCWYFSQCLCVCCLNLWSGTLLNIKDSMESFCASYGKTLPPPFVLPVCSPEMFAAVSSSTVDSKKWSR